jgi:hypothetical protein
MTAEPIRNSPTSDRPSQPASPLSLIVGLGALGLLLVILLLRGNPGPDLPADQRTMAMALVQHMRATGVLMRYSCAQNEAYVTRALWDKYTTEQKRGFAMGLAAVCSGEHAGYRVTVRDADTSQRVASFDGKAFTIP